ncbi:MAG: sugar ABC transporter permease [Acidimicrobiia bacterium]|nr:sugar ABC transporter permease [bacterium]MXX64920.1 sugar ABC transporter permease [Acidimicrobiia bacterium]MCY3580123.1 sugar ABC transporter permease [bacterium]MCY3651562.1 sugar ABC transporter permease [bacterium]MDE0644583.1 sugar ABC transporter permease [bacterium]
MTDPVRAIPLVRTKYRRGHRAAIAMVAPAVLIVAGVYLYPAVATVAYSLSDIDLSPRFRIVRLVWFANFVNQLQSAAFWEATRITLYFGLMLCLLTVALSFAIASLLNQTFLGRGLLRVVVLLPWAVPPVASGVLWVQMFHAEFGFLNGLLRALGAEGEVIWLGGQTIALHSVLIAEVWRWIPFATIFLLAGLQVVPRTVKEAAAIDGAGSWRTFTNVTLPLMMPVVIPVVIFLFVWAMKVFDTIYVLTRGGPSRSTTTLNYLVYRQGFEQFDFGSAAATAYLLSALTVMAIAGLGWMLTRARRLAGT